MSSADLPTPSHARNMRLIGYSDQGGRSDGQQIMVHRGYAYIGHVCSKGFSVVDVRDPRSPKTVGYVANPPNTWSLHLQVHDDLLLLVHARDMFAMPEMADERNYYKRQVELRAAQQQAGRATGRRAWRCSTSPTRPSRGRSALCRSTAGDCTASGTSAGAGPMRRR